MNRRELLNVVGIAALAAAAVPGNTQAADHHTHHSQHAGLVAAALKCVETGEACAAHCNLVLADGETDIARCQATAMESAAICAALLRLAQMNSVHLAKVAVAARDICLACEEECRKHADKHEACKLCGEACKDCAKQCETVAA